MKRIFVLSLLLPALFLACNDNGLDSPNVAPSQELSKLTLSFSAPPPEITQVVAALSRQGYATRTLSLTIHDTTQSASGSFSDVPIGVWHLMVEALDSSAIVRYRGEADVQVNPGQVAQVNLQMLPTSGGIQITVTWGTPNPSGGLVAYYPLNGNANDLSGNGNNGVVSGAVPTANRHGSPNSAFWFDGVNDKITIASSQSLHPLNQLTIAFWIRVDSMQDNYLPVLAKSGAVNPLFNREYIIHVKQTNSTLFHFQVHSSGDGNIQHTVFSNSFGSHQWLFFTAVIDRQSHVMKTYVNGVLNSQVNDSYSSFNTNNFPLLIGMEDEIWPDHSPFLGALDEIRLYNRALTSAEIVALYNMP
ncbi:MAG: hypothetical protein HW412_310 [Bacteroidetes bacterium]|nr:hypothetical protein [Bacteroidota bacterium]